MADTTPPEQPPRKAAQPTSTEVDAPNESFDHHQLPYRIAVLCYLFDADGKILLLHRAKAPNLDRFSPIGGKLEVGEGESPAQCAVREIEEEAGLTLTTDEVHLVGIISERSFEDTGHWLLFCYEVKHPVEIEAGPFEEGVLEWHDVDAVMDLNIPQTDREIIWPSFLKHRGGGFFMLHIECANGEYSWTVDESRLPGNLL